MCLRSRVGMHSYLHWHAYAWFVFHHIWFGCSLRNWIYCVSCLQRSVLAFVAHRWQATFWQIRFRERDLRWPVGFRERYLGQSSVDDMRMRCVSLFSFLYLCATCAAMELPPDDSGPCITGPVNVLSLTHQVVPDQKTPCRKRLDVLHEDQFPGI